VGLYELAQGKGLREVRREKREERRKRAQCSE